MSVMLQFSMFPIGEKESLSEAVAESLKIIQESGINYRFNPMGTVLEGDELGQVMGVVEKCYEKMKQNYNRVYCSITFDYRGGREGGLDSKIKSVEDKLGTPLEK